jgi:hypothetical protein
LLNLDRSAQIAISRYVIGTLITRHLRSYLTDDEYAALQSFLAANPEAGELMPARAAFESFAGATNGVGRESEAASGSSTTS